MTDKNSLDPYTKDFAFSNGFYDGAFDELLETIEDVVAFFDWVSLPKNGEMLLWNEYQKGYQAGKEHQQMSVPILRQLLRERIQKYTPSEKITTRILNGWKNFTLLGMTDKPGITDEEREKFYLLDWLSERTAVFYDNINAISFTPRMDNPVAND